jgi:AcrR family transcriptional regulator
MAPEASGRANQKRRTRKDLLEAAWRLMKQGHKPSLEEIAEAALVSRATAYRYFQSAEAVMVEASLDGIAPDPETLFQKADAHDAAARLRRVDTALHEMVLNNEAPLRMMLAQALERALSGMRGGDLPLRQNRRTPLIEAALAPARDQFDPTTLDRLCKAVALIVGTEGMMVCKDVLQLDDMEARQVKAWAIDALVEAAKQRKDGAGRWTVSGGAPRA